MFKADIGRYMEENLAHSEVCVGKAPVTQCVEKHCMFRAKFTQCKLIYSDSIRAFVTKSMFGLNHSFLTVPPTITLTRADLTLTLDTEATGIDKPSPGSTTSGQQYWERN